MDRVDMCVDFVFVSLQRQWFYICLTNVSSLKATAKNWYKIRYNFEIWISVHFRGTVVLLVLPSTGDAQEFWHAYAWTTLDQCLTAQLGLQGGSRMADSPGCMNSVVWYSFPLETHPGLNHMFFQRHMAQYAQPTMSAVVLHRDTCQQRG